MIDNLTILRLLIVFSSTPSGYVGGGVVTTGGAGTLYPAASRLMARPRSGMRLGYIEEFRPAPERRGSGLL
jgi:hypothetical protein